MSHVEKTIQLRSIAEPYRIFFPLGILMGLGGVLHWFFYGTGMIPAYSSALHAAVQTEAYLGCFIVGFLTTAFPRFTASSPCALWEFLLLCGLVFAAAFFNFAGLPQAGQACYAGWVAALGFFAVRRVLGRRGKASVPPVSPPVEMIWIPVGLLHVLAGTALYQAAFFGYAPASWMGTGRLLSDQGFLLSIVIGIGGFLGPRLMGTFKLAPARAADAVRARRMKMFFHLSAGALVFLSFVLEGAGNVRGAFALRAAVVTAVMASTGALALKPANRDSIVPGVWVSFWMIALGHWAVALKPDFRTAWLHLVFLGGYSLMTFSVATMVIVSHAGEAARLRRPLAALNVVYAALAVALGTRLASPFFPEHYFKLLAFASAVWSAAGVVWLAFCFPYLRRFADPAEMEKAHAEARKRILENKNHVC
jgi:uncharacterized protein involved in response to NO